MPKHLIWKVSFIRLLIWVTFLAWPTNHFSSFCHLCILGLEVNGAKTFFPIALRSSHKTCLKNARAWFFSQTQRHEIKHVLFRNRNSETIWFYIYELNLHSVPITKTKLNITYIYITSVTMSSLIQVSGT